MYFSICVPTYNRKHTLFRTLDSIKNQSFDSYEVLIVDDGSSDGTQEAVIEYIKVNDLSDKYRYFYKENGGKHTALNIGLENAKGKFFIIFDSDDWFVDDGLALMHKYCAQIENDDSFSGIMGRSINSKTNKMIGDLFDLTNPVSSYFEYHFVLPFKMDINDCLEANKTEVVKKYRFPEPEHTKFVNEAWLFDQVGVEYKLLLTNDVFRYVEFQEDGISSDQLEYKCKNIVGYLYHYISRIENVLPKAKMTPFQSFKLYTIAWWRYWEAVQLDKKNYGPRIENISILGHFVRFNMPILNYLYMKTKK